MSRDKSAAAGDGRAIGFGVHQAVEFLLGLFLVNISLRLASGGRAGPVLGLGLALLVLPAVTTGPLAALRILSPAVHKVLDVVLVMLAVTSPLLPLGLDRTSMVMMVLAALALALLSKSTSYVVRRRRPRPAPRVRAAPTRPPTSTAPSPTWARDLGAAAGRARAGLPRHAGRIVGRMKKGRP